MSAFTRQFSASPVLAMSPRPSHQEPLGIATFAHQRKLMSGNPNPSSASLHCPSFLCGRKRPRDEAAANLEPDSSSSSAHTPQRDWVYGEGMVLIKPGTGYVSEASSQSGTWLEERNAIQEARAREVVVPRGHKLRRMNIASASSGTASPCAPNTSISGASDALIDNYTLHLGIGWKSISTEEHIQAAARGWARFIENHYPLSNVNIRLESKGLQSYLVETGQGFYLFSEDLRRARLVSRDVNGAIRNLQSTPPSFEGSETLLKAETPRPLHTPSTDTAMTLD